MKIKVLLKAERHIFFNDCVIFKKINEINECEHYKCMLACFKLGSHLILTTGLFFIYWFKSKILQNDSFELDFINYDG